MSKQTLLIVDDEELNLEILKEYLESEGYDTLAAMDGQDAWEKLEAHPDVAVILLDRMMPRMDGLQFMAKIGRTKHFSHIPVIMQTAATSSQEILEGLRAGVFYYLTKPFQRDVIVNVVKAALENSRSQLSIMHEEHLPAESGLEQITRCELSFRTMEEAERACQFAARLFPDPARVLIGLSELAYNAVEHGNLGISYEEKNQLILEGRLKSEITARLTRPAYRTRTAHLVVERTPEGTRATIRDMGNGFDHVPFLDINPLKVTKLNGRGIAIARMMSFDTMEYNAAGNEVACFCHTDADMQLTPQNQAPAA